MRSPQTGGVIDHSPARATNFRVFIHEFPHIAFFTTDAMIPGINLPEMEMAYKDGTPYLSDNKVEFELMTLGFTVDEYLKSYIEIFRYFMNIANPVGDRGAPENDPNVTIDIEVLDNNKNPAATISYKNCRPTALGQLTYDTQDEQNNNLVSDITFRYDYIKITPAGQETPTGLDSAAGQSIPG